MWSETLIFFHSFFFFLMPQKETRENLCHLIWVKKVVHWKIFTLDLEFYRIQRIFFFKKEVIFRSI